MGKKTNVQKTSEVSASSTNSNEDSQQNSLYARKAKAMILLNEYMRYFGAVSGLHRQMVDLQRDVVCRLGRSAWRTLTQEELDKAFDSHIVHDYIQDGSMLLNTDQEETAKQASSASKNTENGRTRRDSVQSITDLGGQDGFAGPFSWRTKSMQDLYIPNTPEMEVKMKRQGSTSECKEKDACNSNTDDEVKRLMTIEELKAELTRSYQEAQSAREKMQQMKSPKSKKEPEKITKSAVQARLGQTRMRAVGSAKRQVSNGMPVSPIALTPVSSLRPIKQERLKLDARQVSENESRPSDNGPSQSWSADQTNAVKNKISEDHYNGNIQEHSDDSGGNKFGFFYKRSESNGSHCDKLSRNEFSSNNIVRSPRHTTENNQNGVYPSYQDLSSSNGIQSHQSRSPTRSSASPDKKQFRNLSEDLNNYFASKSPQNTNGCENTDMLTDLFKNW